MNLNLALGLGIAAAVWYFLSRPKQPPGAPTVLGTAPGFVEHGQTAGLGSVSSLIGGAIARVTSTFPAPPKPAPSVPIKTQVSGAIASIQKNAHSTAAKYAGVAAGAAVTGACVSAGGGPLCGFAGGAAAKVASKAAPVVMKAGVSVAKKVFGKLF